MVAVGAEDAGAVGVIEEDEIADQAVLVGGDVLAEDAEARVAVAAAEGAEDLVGGAVLRDDVDGVLDEAGFADAPGDGARGLAGAWAVLWRGLQKTGRWAGAVLRRRGLGRLKLLL